MQVSIVVEDRELEICLQVTQHVQDSGIAASLLSSTFVKRLTLL